MALMKGHVVILDVFWATQRPHTHTVRHDDVKVWVNSTKVHIYKEVKMKVTSEADLLKLWPRNVYNVTFRKDIESHNLW